MGFDFELWELRNYTNINIQHIIRPIKRPCIFYKRWCRIAQSPQQLRQISGWIERKYQWLSH